MVDWITEQWKQIRGNLKWDLLKLVGAAMLTGMWALLQRARHLPADVYGYAVLFLGSFLAFMYLGRNQRSTKHPESKSGSQPPSSPLTIHYAGYGLGPGRYMDVTAALNSHVTAEGLNVPVSFSTFGCDPYLGSVKQVLVRYSYSERVQRELVKGEHEQLVLPTPNQILRSQAASVGRELYAFLREKGPDPEPKFDPSMGTSEKLRETVRVRSSYVEGVHYGYERKFRQRLKDLMNELAENGITDTGIRPSDVEPQAQNAQRIKAIAESLLLLSARMEVSEELRGT